MVINYGEEIYGKTYKIVKGHELKIGDTALSLSARDRIPIEYRTPAPITNIRNTPRCVHLTFSDSPLRQKPTLPQRTKELK